MLQNNLEANQAKLAKGLTTPLNPVVYELIWVCERLTTLNLRFRAPAMEKTKCRRIKNE